MARIAGVDLPREKRVEIGLTYIYGIGRTSSNRILAEAGVNPDTRVKDLTDDEVKKLAAIIADSQMVEGDLRREIRQIVDHKHILVNGKCVNIPSYLVKAGDVIEVKEKAKSAQRYKDVLEVTSGRLIPAWLDVDQENLKGVVKELPTRDEIDVPVNEMLIVELYSK